MAVAEPDQIEGDVPEEVSHVLEAARGALEQQFQIAERLDAKARGQMTLAGAWFAVVQAVAGVALRIQDLEIGWKIAILATCAASAAALAVAFLTHYQVWKLRDERDLKPNAIRDFGDWAADPKTDLGLTLVAYYAELLEARQCTNRTRSTKFDAASKVWFWALALPLAELLVSVVASVTV